METDTHSLHVKACTYEKEHGGLAFLKAYGSALNHLLVQKGLITSEEICYAMSAELDSLNAECSEAPISGLATEAKELTSDEAKRIKAALNRYEKIIRYPTSFSSLRCAMLKESVRVAEEFQVKIPEHENRKDIWRVVQVTWDDDHNNGQKSQLLVEASSAAEAATLAGEEDGIHETVSIENLGPVVVRNRN